MLNPRKTQAFGQAKQDRYLQEAESNRLIKAIRTSKSPLHVPLVQGIRQWLLFLGQHAGAACIRVKQETKIASTDRQNLGRDHTRQEICPRQRVYPGADAQSEAHHQARRDV